MNEGAIRVEGLEALRRWVSKDERYISMIGECAIVQDAVEILGRRTIGEGEEGKEGGEGEGEGEGGEEEGEGRGGVSVREKNGILGIVLEVVEGGGWRGGDEELEEVVERLENTIIHHGEDSLRNCFIGGVMTSVLNLFSSSIIHYFSLSLSLPPSLL